MLKTAKQQTATQTVSLDETGGAVMLSLSDGEGHVFRQALDAHDTGKLLEVILGIAYKTDCVLCQGDLVAKVVVGELHFTWYDERGGEGLVQLAHSDRLVFEMALRSYCRMLMRPEGDEP